MSVGHLFIFSYWLQREIWNNLAKLLLTVWRWNVSHLPSVCTVFHFHSASSKCGYFNQLTTFSTHRGLWKFHQRYVKFSLEIAVKSAKCSHIFSHTQTHTHRYYARQHIDSLLHFQGSPSNASNAFQSFLSHPTSQHTSRDCVC